MSPNDETSSPHGRVDDDGTVYLRTPDGERVVGSWQAGSPAEGLAHYMRRYDDLATDVALLQQRLASKAATPHKTLEAARKLAQSLPEAAVVGDMVALEKKLAGVIEDATNGAAAASIAKRAARDATLAAKEELVTRAEGLADSTAWKQTGEQFTALLQDWKAAPTLDRTTDTALWKRYAAARDEFNKRRGTHFSALDATRKLAQARKTELIAEAAALAQDTQWQATATKLKKLMAEWKELPRLSKDAEDRLWTKFRSEQDAFFTRRSEAMRQEDAEHQQRRDQQESARAKRDEQQRAHNPLLESIRGQVARAQQQLDRARATKNVSAVAELERALQAKQHILALAEGRGASTN